MDLHHRVNAFIVRRVQLMMPPLPQGIGPTPFGLWGSLRQQLVASSPAIRGGGLIMMICLPPLIDMARVSPNVSPSQNRL